MDGSFLGGVDFERKVLMTDRLAAVVAAKTDAERSARRVATSPGGGLVARAGLVTRGALYLVVGVLAAEAGMSRGGAATDTVGAIRTIATLPLGQPLLALVVIGFFSFGVYNIAQALLDIEDNDDDAQGMMARLGTAVGGLAYLGLASIGLQLLLGLGNGVKSSEATTQQRTSQLLALPFGTILVILLGIIVLGSAIAQFYQAYSLDFLQRLDVSALTRTGQHWVCWLGRLGIASCGVVASVVGIFLIVAALHHNPALAKGPDGALEELLHHPYGHLLLGIVATGLIAYGLFSFAEARLRAVGPP